MQSSNDLIHKNQSAPKNLLQPHEYAISLGLPPADVFSLMMLIDKDFPHIFEKMLPENIYTILLHMQVEDIFNFIRTDKYIHDFKIKYKDDYLWGGFWEKKFRLHFPHHLSDLEYENAIDWYKEFVKFHTLDYSNLKDTPDIIRLLSLIKDGKLDEIHGIIFSNLNLKIVAALYSKIKNGNVVAINKMFSNNENNSNIYNKSVKHFIQNMLAYSDILGTSLLSWARLCGHQHILDYFYILAKNNMHRHIYSALELAIMCNQSDDAIASLCDNAKIEDLERAFTYLAKEGRKDILEYILSRHDKFNINIVNKKNQTALNLAVKENHTSVVEFLLEKGADPTFRAIYFYKKNQKNVRLMPIEITNLHRAAINGNIEVFSMLYKTFKNIDLRDASDHTPLHWAARYGHAEMVSHLIDLGADVNTMTKSNETPLLQAVSGNHQNVIGILLEKRPELLPQMRSDSYENDIYNPLTFAATLGNLSAFKFLFTKFAKYVKDQRENSKTGTKQFKKTFFYYETLLHIAAEHGNINIIKFLLDKNSNINASNSQYLTPLMIAVKFKNINTIKFLLSNDAKTNSDTKPRETALHIAISGGDSDIIKLLLDHNADCTIARSTDGKTPLHIAAELGQVDTCKLLIERGADVNIQDKKGNTPLHYSAKNTNNKVAIYLLQFKANPYIENRRGKKPSDRSRKSTSSIFNTLNELDKYINKKDKEIISTQKEIKEAETTSGNSEKLNKLKEKLKKDQNKYDITLHYLKPYFLFYNQPENKPTLTVEQAQLIANSKGTLRKLNKQVNQQ